MREQETARPVVLGLLIALPLVPTAGGALLAGGEPEAIARQPLD